MMYSSNGPVYIDPAVYAGDPIVDIAMTRLFGGFPKAFYEGYNEVNPISLMGLEVKIQLYQLFYLLVHVALFGRSYVPSVASILQRYA